MILTLELLTLIMPIGAGRAPKYLEPLNQALAEFNITTPQRVAAFLAQLAHESAEMRYTRELGSSAYLDKYDTGTLAARLGNTPEDDDDGQRLCGRGFFMITGHDNYLACGRALGLDLLAHPELLEDPIGASRSAGWFWSVKGFNHLADTDQFGAMTLKLNGGYNGLDSRIAYWLRSRRAVGI